MLNTDVDSLVGLLNARKADDLALLANTVGWAQKGPLVKADAASSEDSDANDSDGSDEEPLDEVHISQHLSKFSDCGDICFHHARTYYSKDFEVLQYQPLPE